MTTKSRMSAPAVPLGPATSLERLAELSRSPHAAVRVRVAEHLRATPELLARLAEDRDETVRRVAARRLAAHHAHRAG